MTTPAGLTIATADQLPGSAPTSGTTALALVLVAAVVVTAVVLYLLPSIVAAGRHVPNTGAVLVINVLLGWSLVGWLAAFALAVRRHQVPARSSNPPWPASPPMARGWHPDQLRLGRLRFFDGATWTDATANAPAPPA